MLVVHRLEEVPAGPATVCCIGSFDGVHLGHRRLIGDAVAEAAHRGMRSAVITFFPHPRAVIRGSIERYLTLPHEKAPLIEALGVDVMLVQEFTQETVNIRAEAFTRALLSCAGMRSLWAGPDFAFGYRREGTTSWLRARAVELGFDMHVADPVLHCGKVVSSTRVRDALARGDMAEVHELLGRPYSIAGQVGDDGRAVELDRRRIWPAPGEYAVVAAGRANHLRIETHESSAFFEKRIPFRTPCCLDVIFA